MAKTKKPSVWTVTWGKPLIIPPKKKSKKPRKTVAQKLDSVVLRSMDAYGCHRQTSEQHGWGGVQAHAHIAYQRAQRAIRRIMREVRRG